MFVITETGKYGVRKRDCATLDSDIFDIPDDSFKLEVRYSRHGKEKDEFRILCIVSEGFLTSSYCIVGSIGRQGISTFHCNDDCTCFPSIWPRSGCIYWDEIVFDFFSYIKRSSFFPINNSFVQETLDSICNKDNLERNERRIISMMMLGQKHDLLDGLTWQGSIHDGDVFILDSDTVFAKCYHLWPGAMMLLCAQNLRFQKGQEVMCRISDTWMKSIITGRNIIKSECFFPYQIDTADMNGYLLERLTDIRSNFVDESQIRTYSTADYSKIAMHSYTPASHEIMTVTLCKPTADTKLGIRFTGTERPYIMSFTDDGVAAKTGCLHQGDVILKINHQPVIDHRMAASLLYNTVGTIVIQLYRVSQLQIEKSQSVSPKKKKRKKKSKFQILESLLNTLKTAAISMKGQSAVSNYVHSVKDMLSWDHVTELSSCISHCNDNHIPIYDYVPNGMSSFMISVFAANTWIYGSAAILLQYRGRQYIKNSRKKAKIQTTVELDNLCVICDDNASNHIFIPCGHICICGSCVTRFVSNPKCPMCRTVGQIFQTYR